MPTSKVLTVPQAAQIAGVHATTIRRACQRGTLKAQRPGNEWLIVLDDLQQWISNPALHQPGVKPK